MSGLHSVSVNSTHGFIQVEPSPIRIHSPFRLLEIINWSDTNLDNPRVVMIEKRRSAFSSDVKGLRERQTLLGTLTQDRLPYTHLHLSYHMR